MKIRADIAELLRQGVPQSHIARQLHCAPITVQRHREALGIAPKSCRVLPATLEEAFHQYTRPTPDGHVEWTGPVCEGTPRLTFQGTVLPARHVAFLLHHGRKPDGRVTACTNLKGCVAPACLRDKPMREQERQQEKNLDRLYAGIFGAAR